MQEITKSNFNEEVLKSKVPVLVDNFAVWCSPCKALSPVLEELSFDFKGKVKFVKVDVDKNPDLAQTYSVMSIPTLILFKDGKVIDHIVGLRMKDDLEEWLNENI